MMNINDKLRLKIIERRKELKYSQSKVAIDLSMSIRTYQRIEHGEGELTINQYINICSILKVQLSEFMPSFESRKSKAKSKAKTKDEGDQTDNYKILQKFINVPEGRTFSDSMVKHIDLDTVKQVVYSKREINESILGSWEWNIKTGEIHWSDNMYEIYMFEKGEKEAATMISEYIHTEDMKVIDTGLAQLVDKGIPYVNTHRYIKDGVEKIIHAFGFKFIKPNGEIIIYGLARHKIPGLI